MKGLLLTLLAAATTVSVGYAQQTTFDRLPQDIFDVVPPSARVNGAPGTMAIQSTSCRTLPTEGTRRLIVGDRGNNRLQIFQLDGTYIGELRQFGRPSGIYITDDDTIYVADSESLFANSQNPGWITGIRVGSLTTGIVDHLIHGAVTAYPNGSNPEGVSVDAAGNVYGAVVSQGGAFVRSSR